MADDFLYISRNRLEMNHGLRHAYTGDVPAPVVYGVQGELKSHYGVPEDAPPIASNWTTSSQPSAVECTAP